MSLTKYKNLIESMPIKEQAFESNLETWDKFKDLEIVNETLYNPFGTKTKIKLSRNDLFELSNFQENIPHSIISIIVWGYPRGMRGNSFKKIIKQINELSESILTAKREPTDWNYHQNILNNIEGLGLSTYSKLLYFHNIKIENKKSLILDERIIKTINKSIFSEFEDLKGINYSNAPAKYTKYLSIMETISHKLSIDSEKLEMFLFTFGNNLKLE